MLFMFRKHHLYFSILIIMYYFLFSIMKYMVFGYGVYGIWILFGYNIYLVALHHVALHCIAFGVMSQTYGCDCTDIASVYWAWRYRLSIPCWIWRKEFICIHMHTSLVWHRDAAWYFVGYEGRSSSASICIHR